MTFDVVIKAVREWFAFISNNYKNIINFEIAADNKDVFIVDFDTNRYIAQLVVENEGFHPHRFVSFIALDIEKDIFQKDAYSYYDNNESTIDEIIEQLNKGISFITRYS